MRRIRIHLIQLGPASSLEAFSYARGDVASPHARPHNSSTSGLEGPSFRTTTLFPTELEGRIKLTCLTTV